MKYNRYYVSDKIGKSNCVIRTFCKLFDEEYEKVYKELCDISEELNCTMFNDIEVFETYLKRRNTEYIEYGEDTKLSELKMDNGKYAIFCWDKKDFYHMVSVVDNVIYDKDDKCMDLFVIKIYKEKILKNKHKM